MLLFLDVSAELNGDIMTFIIQCFASFLLQVLVHVY